MILQMIFHQAFFGAPPALSTLRTTRDARGGSSGAAKY